MGIDATSLPFADGCLKHFAGELTPRFLILQVRCSVRKGLRNPLYIYLLTRIYKIEAMLQNMLVSFLTKMLRYHGFITYDDVKKPIL